jgi:hypothetical protein
METIGLQPSYGGESIDSCRMLQIDFAEFFFYALR